MTKEGEVRRSEVVVWGVRGGRGEEAVSEWKERRQPMEVMTHINYEAESLKLNADSDGCISQSRGRDMEEIILHQRFFFFF